MENRNVVRCIRNNFGTMIEGRNSFRCHLFEQQYQASQIDWLPREFEMIADENIEVFFQYVTLIGIFFRLHIVVCRVASKWNQSIFSSFLCILFGCWHVFFNAF